MINVKKLLFVLGLVLGLSTMIQAEEAPLGTNILFDKSYDGVKVRGNYTYLLSNKALTILNTTNVAIPIELGSFYADRDLEEMDIAGDYAYILTRFSSALLIVDISTPSAPTLIRNSLSMGGDKIDVSGNYAYVLDGGVMKVIDITTPLNPILLHNHSTGMGSFHEPKSIIIRDDFAYILASAGYGDSKLYTIKIDDLDNIRSWGEYTYSTRVLDMKLSVDKTNVNDYIYVLDRQGLKILEQSNPSTNDITLVGYNSYNITWNGAVPVYTGYPRKLDVLGDRAYVTDDVHDLLIFDISDASNPTILYRDTAWGSLTNIDTTFSHTYVIKPNYGLKIIDISVLSNVSLVSNYIGLYDAKSIATKGSYAYIGDDYGLKVVDITNPTTPKIVNAYSNDGDKISHIALKENYAYISVSVSSGNPRLLQLDITDPLNLLEVSSRDESIMAILHTQIVGDYAYSLRPMDIIIYDLTKDPSITFISEYTPLQRPYGFVIVGNYAYVLGPDTLDIVDITNPSNPILDHTLSLPSGAVNISKEGYFIYITGTDTLEIYNTSTPRFPVHVNSGYTSDTSLGVSTIGQYMYTKSILSGEVIEKPFKGITAVNVSDSHNPVVVAGYNTPSSPIDLKILENYAYTVNGDDGMSIIKIKMTDTDTDGIADVDDTDDDNDGTLDVDDAFPLDASESADTDTDGIGNNADTDDDNDGILDVDDAFPEDASESVDTDKDGIGNNADRDDDGDGVFDNDDAFPLDASETLDTDEDGIGNNADTDDDGDGVLDGADAFPLDKTETVDTDNDGVGDNADAFPHDPTETLDTDKDGEGNNADKDDDGDGATDDEDAFPLDSTETLDTDNDGIGNNADTDDDGDGVSDNNDAFPLDPIETLDTDKDGVGDNADAFPLDDSETLDTDTDGIGNNEDTDDDDDGVKDNEDAFPLDATETVDTDADGIGNNADLDDDGDGYSDIDELAAGTNPLDANSKPVDSGNISPAIIIYVLH